jgi:adenosylcobinamide-phosphate synthase
MSRRTIIVAASLLDLLAGDPEWFPHPVRGIGLCIDKGERTLRSPQQTASAELIAGGLLTLSIVAATYLATDELLRWTYRRSKTIGFIAQVLFSWTCLASRNLHDEATAVVNALEANNVALARQRLSRIVGRDTQHLGHTEMSRAVIETVSESCSDGIIAPLFYMAIGGVPLAMAYKAVNTLDSMIGHADARYLYFGKSAARLDDVANILPSRLTALLIATAAITTKEASPSSSIRIWLRDGMKHKSPNAGQPESAMAGALQVQLGGQNFYDGVPSAAPIIGEGFYSPTPERARAAIKIAAVVSALGLLTALLLRTNK